MWMHALKNGALLFRMNFISDRAVTTAWGNLGRLGPSDSSHGCLEIGRRVKRRTEYGR